MNEQTKRLAQKCRKWMRSEAGQYREAIRPVSFDGTLETYHRNIKRGMEALQTARFWRDQSHKLVKLAS